MWSESTAQLAGRPTRAPVKQHRPAVPSGFASLPNGTRALTAAVLVLPGTLLFGLSFFSGGFFPDAVAVATVAVLGVFAFRTLVSPEPFAGLRPAFSLVAIALIGFTAWTQASGAWSGSPAKSTFEYDRALLYTAIFVLTGMVGRSARRAQLLLHGLALAATMVSIAAVATWLLPHAFPVSAQVARDRLAWPTTYWNATGLIAAFALTWTTALSCSDLESPRSRVISAMAIPFPTAALIFTASRGAVAVALVGLLIAITMIRSSATPGGLAAITPAIVVSVCLALGVHGLNVTAPAGGALDAGRQLVWLLLAVSLATGAIRIALLRVDGVLRSTRVPWTRRQFRAAVVGAAAAAAVVFIELGGPHAIGTAAHRFASPETESVSGQLAPDTRLTRFGNNGRLDTWRVAIVDGFDKHPVIGTGAGTYADLWTRYGPTPRRVLDAHSLYLQELAELGIIGGGAMIVIVASILVGLARRARGPERQAWAALFAAAVMWAVHAGVDWDWEMPAVTAWFFAAGGLALGAPFARRHRAGSVRVRVAAIVGCVTLAVTPVLVWRSQTQIVTAVHAFENGNCLAAEHAALASNAALSSRADPFEVIAYCEAGAGRFELSLGAIQAAEDRDPQNWELRYSEALIRGVAGLDPRAAARAALVRYPTSPLTRAAVRAFGVGSERDWRRFAVSAPLPLPRSRQ